MSSGVADVAESVEKLRLFIGVGLPAEAAAALDAGLGQRPGRAGLRWVDPAQWHVTLQFLGWVEPSRVDDVRLAVAFGAGRVRPFEVSYAGVGAFPSERRARVVWVGVAEGADRLAALATSIQGQTSKRGFELEDREFRAHLTIGRLRNPTAVGDVLAGLDVGPVRTGVHEVALFRSHMGQSGARYEVLDTFPLQT